MNVTPHITVSPDAAAKKSDRTRFTILTAAAKQFRASGYGPSTLRRIADAAGVEAGSIYYHFASKEEIFDAVLDKGLRQLYHAVREAGKTCEAEGCDFRETFVRMLHYHLVYLLKENDFTSANIRNFSMLPLHMRERHRPLRMAYAELWEELLQKALREKQIRSDIKVAPLRHFLLGALNWMGEWFYASHYPVSALSEGVATLILDGMLVETRKHPFPVEEMDFLDDGLIELADSKVARTRMHILSSAAKVMRANGYSASTLRRIAAEAKMEAGSIYYHFKSKEHLLDAVLDRGLREMANGVSRILYDIAGYPDSSWQIAAAINAHMRVLFARSEFTSANIRMYGQLSQEIRQRHRPVRLKYAAAWDACLKNAQENRIIRSDIKVVPLRLFMIGALNWTVEWFDPEKGGQDGYYSLQEMIALQQSLLLNGIAHNGGMTP
ncbi:TetR/AcrR family transcriptional regulator [Sneathiella sp.]|uniref:TetR/AcrR family transcriptional regulator n=1 Tax=Sneathiella sp. TaxID=1964365 RepID=UPI00260BEC43|nr:TetR/AcrR family transcriptional regulator [Sneathiella sp.]MDF2367141.1 TetR/AcrR family transcriptional regulator [Sneathiella sp.]